VNVKESWRVSPLLVYPVVERSHISWIKAADRAPSDKSLSEDSDPEGYEEASARYRSQKRAMTCPRENRSTRCAGQIHTPSGRAIFFVGYRFLLMRSKKRLIGCFLRNIIKIVDSYSVDIYG